MKMYLPMAWFPLFFIVLSHVGLSPSSLAYSAEEFASAGRETTPEIAKRIVIRSLPAIQEGGQSWINENDCLSCHRVSLQVWALNRAEEQGFTTDRKQLSEWNSWATSWRNLVKPHLRSEISMETALTSESDTVAQLLLGRPRWRYDQPVPGTTSQVEDPGKSEWIARFRDHLAKAQRDDGSWEPAGQLPKQKRPLRETTEVTTMWALLALYDAGLSKPRMNEVFSTANTFLDKAAEPQSTEWLATELMVSRKFGSTAQAQASRRNLLRTQQADGGWGWLTRDSSDALATGLALYALAQDGLSYSDQPVQKAIAFLARTQRPDGMWNVKGTKVEDRDNVVETASYWGTAWVAISLLEFQQTESRRDGIETKLESGPHRPKSEILTSFAGNEFENRIRPLLMKYCNDCHAGPYNYGVNFMNLEAAENFAEYQHRFVSVVREMESGTMPPKDADQPTVSEREFMVGWLRLRLETLTPPGKPVIPDVSQQIAQYVVQIYEDRKGNLWFGTMSRGAARYDGQSVTYLTKKNGLPGGGVTSFAEDAAGNLWIGTQEGICRYDGKSIVRFGESDGLPLLNDRRSPAPPGGGNVIADKDQNIWANMLSGVFRWQNNRFVRFEIPFDRDLIKSHGIVPGNASLALEDRDGNKWFTVDGLGVLRFDGTKFKQFTKQDGLCSNNVNDILQDKQGNIWFACMQSHQPKQTGDGGLCRFNGKIFETFEDLNGLHHNDIYTIGMERKGNIWIGATGVGIYRYNGEEFVLFDKTDRMDLTWSLGLQAFHQAKDETIWLGFSGGLFRVHGDSLINVDRNGPWDSVGVVMSRHVLGERAASQWLAEEALAALNAVANDESKEAASLWLTLQKENPTEPTVQENAMNVLGYELLFAGRAKAATDVFQINTQLYPDAFNTFDSLAEAYLRQGEEDLAANNYERSLKLNPDNANAADRLREIAAGKRYRERLVAPQDWGKEVITVPPSFAPTIALKGMEHLRLPPGFRDIKSDWFLSYLFAIELAEPAKLDQRFIGQQLLAYFRGLASGSRDAEGRLIDVTEFSIKPKPTKLEDEFVFELEWREPFSGGNPLKQLIRVKVLHDAGPHGVLFICGSPQPLNSDVWEQLLAIRSKFEASAPTAEEETTK